MIPTHPIKYLNYTIPPAENSRENSLKLENRVYILP